MIGSELALMTVDYVLLWAAAGTALLGIGLRICLGINYGRLIDEVDKMTTTKNRDLRRCKVKYEKCYAMNQGVANVGAFVDRFMSKLSLGPFTYLALYQMGAQMILLAIILMALLICHRILVGESLLRLLPYYAACFAGLYVFLAITVVVNVQEKRRVLKISLVDYLENHLTARLESVGPNMAKIKGENVSGNCTGRTDGRAVAGRGQAVVAQGTGETKPLPKVAVGQTRVFPKVSVKNETPCEAPNVKKTMANGEADKSRQYQELTQLLEEFFVS